MAYTTDVADDRERGSVTLRISELLKLSQPQGPAKEPGTLVVPTDTQRPPTARATPSFPSFCSHASSPNTESFPTDEAKRSAALYAELLAEAQRCMTEAQHEQRFALGEVPALVEQAVHRLLNNDPELLRLSTTGPGTFSLAHHGVNVAILAVRVGIERGEQPASLVDLGVAALLHDIGMVTMSHLVEAPQRLGAEQRAGIHEHPVVSHRLVERCVGLPSVVRTVIAQEHEREDGSGYPQRLRGRDIHDHAQVLGLLDIYESLTHERPYRPRLVPSDAMRTILREHRFAFRAPVLRAFLDAIPIFPVASWVQLDTGELAKVVATDRANPLAPTVTILINQRGKPRARPETVNLAAEQRVSIVRAVPEPINFAP